MVFRLAQVSDAHLSPSKPVFAANFARVAEEVRGWRPDLLIATGDLSLNGADSDEDLQHAAGQHAAIGADWLAVPGNHDVGDDASLDPAQPANAARIARWTRVLGNHGFVRDVPGWRLIGYDTQSLSVAAGPWAMLEEAIAGAGARRIALFQHKPLCEEQLSDTAINYWPVLPPARARLLDLFRGMRPALVASGHLHQWRDRVAEGMRQLWAPSTGFIVGEDWQASFGERRLGWVEHILHPDGAHEARLRQTPGLVAHDIARMPEVYGSLGEPDADADPKG